MEHVGCIKLACFKGSLSFYEFRYSYLLDCFLLWLQFVSSEKSCKSIWMMNYRRLSLGIVSDGEGWTGLHNVWKRWKITVAIFPRSPFTCGITTWIHQGFNVENNSSAVCLNVNNRLKLNGLKFQEDRRRIKSKALVMTLLCLINAILWFCWDRRAFEKTVVHHANGNVSIVVQCVSE